MMTLIALRWGSGDCVARRRLCSRYCGYWTESGVDSSHFVIRELDPTHHGLRLTRPCIVEISCIAMAPTGRVAGHSEQNSGVSSADLVVNSTGNEPSPDALAMVDA